MAVAWGCNGSKPGAASRPDSTAPPAEAATPVPVDTAVPEWSSPELEQWISRLTTVLDTSLTLQGWVAEHPADTVSQAMPTGLNAETFCRSAAAPITSGTKVWRRSAIFLIPPAIPGERLPETTGLAGRICRLRALWLERAEQDSLQAFQVASALHAHLARLLGEARPDLLLVGSGTGRWHGGRSWINGKQVVVVGAEPGSSHYLEYEEGDTAPIVQLPTAVAVSYVTGNGLDTDVNPLVDQTIYPRVEPEALTAMARGDSAIERAGLSGLLPLRQLFERYRDSANFEPKFGRPRQSPYLDSRLIHGLAVLGDTSSLPHRQQSAAFLAADIAVQTHARALDYGGGRDSMLRMALERVGALYEDRHLGGGYFYMRPWLWRAYQLDSLGPSGKSAFAELLANGWGTGVRCGPPPIVADAVIGRGERAVAAGQTDPMVRLDLAQAYADVFSLSPEGARESDSDSVKALAERSETGRLRAIEHYRVALRHLRDPGLRRTTWDNAVRLMLGLPIETRYFCNND
ncbi:MAG: hypothetical protein M3Q37_07355 [Gemmatimonadota bacterium]|nr:hypothetical protein [Gemmatimonadota bacterium]